MKKEYKAYEELQEYEEEEPWLLLLVLLNSSYALYSFFYSRVCSFT
jgi:hypothetical protein